MIAFVTLCIVGISTALNVARFSRSEHRLFQRSCESQALAFEDSVERWVIRDQLESLESTVRLLLLGSIRYVGIVVQEQTVLSMFETGLLQEEPSALSLEEIPSHVTAYPLEQEDIMVVVPLVLAGYPETPFGAIQVWFSGRELSERIRSYALSLSSIGLGAWLLVIGGGAIGVNAYGRQQAFVLEERSREDRCEVLKIDISTCEVRLRGQQIMLTPKLFDLLLILAKNQGQVFSDQELLDLVWPDSEYATSADVKQHIYLLRKALRQACPNPKQLIVNVKGFGYKLSRDAIETDLRGIS